MVYITAFNIGQILLNPSVLSSPPPGLASISRVRTNRSKPRARILSQSLVIVTSNLSWFLVTKTFSAMQRILGLASPFLAYGGVSLLGVVFVYFFVLPNSTRSRSRRG